MDFGSQQVDISVDKRGMQSDAMRRVQSQISLCEYVAPRIYYMWTTTKN